MIGSVGGMVFLATWLLYCDFFGLPFSDPFIRNIGSLVHSESVSHFILARLWGFKNILFFATPFFILMILVVFVNRTKLYFKNKKLEEIDFLVIVGLLIFLEYLIIGSYRTQDFPRYFSPMMFVFSVVFACYFEMLRELKRNDLYAVVFVSVVVMVYAFLVLKDPLLIDRIIFNTASIYKIMEETAMVTVLYFLSFVISYTIFRALKARSVFVLSIIVSLLICSVYIDAIQVKADYATAYFYGEKGMKDVIEYLTPHIDHNSTVVARKDVAYYLAVKEFYRLPENPEELKKLINNKGIKYIIINKEGYFTSRRYANTFKFIGEKYELKAQFGDFKIYAVGG